MTRRLLLLSTAFALAPQSVLAQSAPAGEDGAAQGDIVVTAQKRAQRITDVPMSISAYGDKFLEQIDATELTKVAAITPGLVIALQDKFAPGFSIRGLTSTDFMPTAEQRVAIFQDGVAVMQTASAYGEMFDVDRIEVEKGPQSTMHGRSALSGSVSMFQKRPTYDLSFEAKGSLGNYDSHALQAIVNLPVSDSFTVRFGALKRKRDGFVKNLTGGSYNAIDAQAYRFAARWEPSTDFSFNLIATYDVDDTKGGVPFQSIAFLPRDQDSGAVIGDLDYWTPTVLSSFGELPEPFFKRKILGLSGTAEWRLDDRLSLTSISGYRWYDACQAGDNDGTTTNLIGYHQCNDGKQLSEEVRLNFKDIGIFEGFIGAGVFHADNAMDMRLGYDERTMALLLGGALQPRAPMGFTLREAIAALGPTAAFLKPYHEDRTITTGKILTWDLFADATAHLTDRLDLFFGGRMTWDKKDTTIQGLSPFGVSTLTGAGLLQQPTAGNAVLEGGNRSTLATGRAGLRYALTPDVNLYAVYGIGKRPEVLQLNPSGERQIAPAEVLKSMEAGVKFRLLDGRLVGDASVFHYKYSNFQTVGWNDEGQLATVNAGKADATGFEAQINYELVRGVALFGSYGFNHARLRSGLYEGNYFRNSPDHKFAIGGNFETPLADGTLSFTPVYSWQSKMFFGEDNDKPELQVRANPAYADTAIDEFQPGYGLLSARLGFAARDGQYSVTLIGDNLTDKKFLVDAGNLGDYFGLPTFIAGTRRTVRVEVGVKF